LSAETMFYFSASKSPGLKTCVVLAHQSHICGRVKAV
jgi:hypothetical protein